MKRGIEGFEPTHSNIKSRNVIEGPPSGWDDSPELRRVIAEATSSLPREIIQPLEVPQYRQKDQAGCFYASLLAGRKGLTARDHFQPRVEELDVTELARVIGVMNERGAATDVQNYASQVGYVRHKMGLNIRFIENKLESARACVTEVANGKPVIFGLPGHWVLAHGIDNREGRPESLKWITMDPMRHEPSSMSVDTVIQRLNDRNYSMPTIVIEGLVRDEPPSRHQNPLRIGRGGELPSREQLIRNEWLRGLRQGKLAKRLRSYAREGKATGAEMTVYAPDLVHMDQLEAGDGLGCAVTCYRMMLSALGKEVPSQQETRRTLDREGHIPGGGHREASVSTPAAAAVGVENPINLLQLRNDPEVLPEKERAELRDAYWPELLTAALEKGYIAMAALPMGSLYENTDPDSQGKHAVIIYGLEYNNGQFNFKIHDPLNKNRKLLSDTQLINGIGVDYYPTIILTSNKYLQRMRSTKLLNEKRLSGVERKKTERTKVPRTTSVFKPGASIWVKRSDDRVEGDWRIHRVSKSTGDIIVRKQEGGKERERRVTKSEAKALNSIQRLLRHVETFHDLYRALRLTTGIAGSKRFFEGSELIKLIEAARHDPKQLEEITRNFGLKQKVRELLEKERKK